MNPPTFTDNDWRALREYLNTLARTVTKIEGGEGKTADFQGATLVGKRQVANTVARQGEVSAVWMRFWHITAAAGGSKAIVSDERGEYTYLGEAASGTTPAMSLWTVYRMRFITNPINQLQEVEVETAAENPTAQWSDRLNLTF